MALLSSLPAEAAGKKRPQSPAPAPTAPLKRAIQLSEIEDHYIELPHGNGNTVYYGKNIHTALITQLQKTGQLAIVLEDPVRGKETMSLGLVGEVGTEVSAPPDPCLVDTTHIPSSAIRIRVSELRFTTGSRGNRVQYGFSRVDENPYNSGLIESNLNEFPLDKQLPNDSWFGNGFNDWGGLRTGLELGHEVNFRDLLPVGFGVQKAEYHSSIGLDVAYDNRLGGREKVELTSRGDGFYWDFTMSFFFKGGHYSAGATAAKRAALLEAFDRAIDSSVKSIAARVARIPAVARLAGSCETYELISIGADYFVPVGQRFYNRTQLEAGVRPSIITVEEVFQRTSRVKIQGTGWKKGDEIVSLAAGEPVPQPGGRNRSGPAGPTATGLTATAEGLTISDETITRDIVDAGHKDLPPVPDVKIHIDNAFVRFFKAIGRLVILPYSIWRYKQYDKKYEGGELKPVDFDTVRALARRHWAARELGLEQAWLCQYPEGCTGSRRLIVAVIDTGVDYNHPELRRSIFWDGKLDSPGWDFLSGDPRPFDDHAHGTEVASALAGHGGGALGAAPGVTVLPIKVFSPYGQTTSSALYAGVEYAIRSGARILVLGWGTRRYSRALEEVLRFAQESNVLVVVGAGDAGVNLGETSYYPAAFSSLYENLLVVAAHGRDGKLLRTKKVASNYGELVHLSAPGAGLMAANPRGEYKERGHTGLAAGMTAGTAALVLSRCPRLTGLEVKDILINSARSLPSLGNQVPGNRALSAAKALELTDRICK